MKTYTNPENALKRLSRDQRAIGLVQRAWKSLPVGKFGSPADKEDWRWRLADGGWNWRLATGACMDEVVAQQGTPLDFVVDWAARVETLDAIPRTEIPDSHYQPRSMMAV